LKDWTTPEFRNTPSTTNLEEEEIVDAPENDDKASMPEQVKRPNPWRKKIMMMMKIKVHDDVHIFRFHKVPPRFQMKALLKFPGHNTTGLLHAESCQEYCLPITSYRNR
jgi:hypothetical protein